MSIQSVTSHANIASMLQTLQSAQLQAAAGVNPAGLNPGAINPGAQVPAVGKPGFTDMVRNAVSEVNQTQQHSRSLQTAYDRGEPVPLHEVVLGMQKSSLAFEATLQVRNKVLKAYEDILNMPV
jgi:flagellar hook-basal body complex protein FliE